MNSLIDAVFIRMARKAEQLRERFPSEELPARVQAGHWINFPLYISQPLIPILAYLHPDFAFTASLVIGFTVCNYAWIRRVSMHGVSPFTMRLSDKIVFLKWVASPLCAVLLRRSHAVYAALLAFLWPFLVLLLLVPLHRFWSPRDLEITKRGFRLAAKEARAIWRSHRRCA